MFVFVFAAMFADALTSYDPVTTNSTISLARPGGAHVFGADFMGRDVYSRIVYGARISLAVGIASPFLSCALRLRPGPTPRSPGGWIALPRPRPVRATH